MLSSDGAASGTNLTKAELVILLDPVYGSYEFRKNTEGQAIGRAHRMGQEKQVTVVRFIIKGTVEEEIYDMNKKEDEKLNISSIKFETSGEDITLDQEQIDKIAEDAKLAEENKKNKKTKVDKKVITKKVVELQNDDTDGEW